MHRHARWYILSQISISVLAHWLNSILVFCDLRYRCIYWCKLLNHPCLWSHWNRAGIWLHWAWSSVLALVNAWHRPRCWNSAFAITMGIGGRKSGMTFLAQWTTSNKKAVIGLLSHRGTFSVLFAAGTPGGFSWVKLAREEANASLSCLAKGKKWIKMQSKWLPVTKGRWEKYDVVAYKTWLPQMLGLGLWQRTGQF